MSFVSPSDDDDKSVISGGTSLSLRLGNAHCYFFNSCFFRVCGFLYTFCFIAHTRGERLGNTTFFLTLMRAG